jgi:hypothetical protein
MKSRQDIIAGILTMLLALVGLAETRSMPTGVAMLPLCALGTLLILSFILIIRGIVSARQGKDSTEVRPFIVAPKRLATGIAAMALYILGIEVIGFYLTTALFMPLTAFALGTRNIRAIAIASISYLGFIYVIFTVMFNRVLPAGIAFTFLVGISLSLGAPPFPGIESYV